MSRPLWEDETQTLSSLSEPGWGSRSRLAPRPLEAARGRRHSHCPPAPGPLRRWTDIRRRRRSWIACEARAPTPVGESPSRLRPDPRPLSGWHWPFFKCDRPATRPTVVPVPAQRHRDGRPHDFDAAGRRRHSDDRFRDQAVLAHGRERNRAVEATSPAVRDSDGIGRHGRGDRSHDRVTWVTTASGCPRARWRSPGSDPSRSSLLPTEGPRGAGSASAPPRAERAEGRGCPRRHDSACRGYETDPVSGAGTAVRPDRSMYGLDHAPIATTSAGRDVAPGSPLS